MNFSSNMPIDSQQLKEQISKYENQIEVIMQYYKSNTESLTIGLDTKIENLSFTEDARTNHIIINCLKFGGAIKTLGELLDYCRYKKLEKIRGLGPILINTIQNYLDKLSLEPASITDLYYKMIQDANKLYSDICKINSIYDSLRYLPSLEDISNTDLVEKLEIRNLYASVENLIKKCNAFFDIYTSQVFSLKHEFQRIVDIAQRGEFIESKIIDVSQPDSSTELKKQIEKYRTMVNKIYAKYITDSQDSPINLNTEIRGLAFTDSKNHNTKIKNKLYQHRTVLDLLDFYVSSNNPFNIYRGRGLSQESIEIIEMFIDSNLVPLLFSRNITDTYYDKSDEDDGLLKDIQTIYSIYKELSNINFQERLPLDDNLYPDDSFVSSLVKSTTDDSLRLKLNKRALYYSQDVRGLLSVCQKYSSTLNKIQECLDKAIQPTSNKSIFKKLYSMYNSNSRQPGGTAIE
ncbi:MAG TPA: hypothetical protein DEP51_05145 [Clostridiales bacterium]|nr:hypothetical protein [Clostridiales bacterium]